MHLWKHKLYSSYDSYAQGSLLSGVWLVLQFLQILDFFFTGSKVAESTEFWPGFSLLRISLLSVSNSTTWPDLLTYLKQQPILIKHYTCFSSVNTFLLHVFSTKAFARAVKTLFLYLHSCHLALISPWILSLQISLKKVTAQKVTALSHTFPLLPHPTVPQSFL